MGKFLKEKRVEVKTLMAGDKGWFLDVESPVLIPRASFSINPKCPKEYRDILMTCINNSWIKPVAYVKESEFMWEQLGG